MKTLDQSRAAQSTRTGPQATAVVRWKKRNAAKPSKPKTTFLQFSIYDSFISLILLSVGIFDTFTQFLKLKYQTP